jgi:hypothetical protein
MQDKTIGAKIEKSGYRSLEFLVAQPPNPVISQRVCGESQSSEEVCMTRSVESQAGGICWILEMPDMGEGQGCTLCKEGQDLVLQYFVAEEAKKLEEDFPPYHVMGGNAWFF